MTNLFNRTMPFIRYGLGDLTTIISGSDSRCTCGYRGPSLTPVLGREMQFFRLANGTRVSQRTVATFVNQVLRNLKQDTEVQRYQVIQERIDRIHVRILAHSELPTNVIEAIARGIERLGPEIRCTVELVDDLPPDASGKFRRFISKV